MTYYAPMKLRQHIIKRIRLRYAPPKIPFGSDTLEALSEIAGDRLEG